jgi:hypothetical protein
VTKTLAAEAIQKNDKIRGVIGLVAEIRNRIDNGHYNFMTWNGRTGLLLKLNEYESYAKELHTSRSAAVANGQKQKLKSMEEELHTLLDSTY